jgi:hypothetical protein
MNPSLYPWQDPEVKDLSQRIDTSTDKVVSTDELKKFLDTKDIVPDTNKLLQVLSSKESELRKISWLESAVKSLTESVISRDLLKIPFDKMTFTDTQKAAILLHEWLYWGKSLWGEKSVSPETTKVDNKDKNIENSKKTELTQNIWDKYTLKRIISNVSGLPSTYTANLDEIKLSDDKKSATLDLYMVEKWVLINKEVKDNKSNNDSQTTIKFERQSDGSRWLSSNKEDKDKTLIRLQDGSQIVRLPQSDGSVQDFKISLGNSLELKPHMPNQEYFNKIDWWKGIGAFGTGVKLSKMLPYVDKEHDSAYYIADLTFNNKSLWQQILFDQNGKPLNSKKYWVKTPWMPWQVYETTDSEKNFYVNKLQDTNTKPNDITKVTELKNYETKIIDTDIKSVDLDKSLLNAWYVVDHVPTESVYHIAQRDVNNGGKLDSKLTITQNELTKLSKWEILPIYLKDIWKYYNLKAIDGKIALQEDKTIEEKKNKISENLKKTLELWRKNWLWQERFARYGGLQSWPVISNVQYVGPKEDMYLDEKARKQDKLLFQAVLWLPNASQNLRIKTATILMEWNQLQGMPEDYKSSSDFVKSSQEVTIETNDILKTYIVGMKDWHIAFEEKYIVKSWATEKDKTKIEQEEKNAFKQFIESYHDIDGKKMFEWKSFTEIKNNKWEFIGYLVDTTKKWASQSYTSFDMKGNIISKLPIDAKTDDNKDLTKVKLDASYEVKNKNERVIGLTQEWDQAKELSEKIQSAPDKIKNFVKEGGFQWKAPIEYKTPWSQKVEGFIVDVIRSENVVSSEKWKNWKIINKEKPENVTYRVLFNIDGTVNTTKDVYKLDSNWNSTKVDIFRAKVIGEKLVIDKESKITSAESDLIQAKQRKELINSASQNGVVRFEKDKKVYELTKQQAEDYAYQRLQSDPLIKKQLDYKKKEEDITKKYAIKIKDPINKDDYKKDTPAYNAINNNPFYNKEQLNQFLDIQKEKELQDIKSEELSNEQKDLIQIKINEFIAIPDNFKDFEVKTLKEIKSNTTVSTVETKNTLPKTVVSPKQEIIIAGNNEKADIQSIVSGFKDTIRFDGNPTVKIINNIPTIIDVHPRDPNTGKVIVGEKPVSIKYENWAFESVDQNYTFVKDNSTNKQILVPVEKNTTLSNQVSTPSSSSEQPSTISNKKESNELPTFRWSKYINNPPALNFVTEQWQIADKNWFTKEQANQDRTSDFWQLIKFVREYSWDNIALKELQSSIINKNATDIIEKVQDWSLDHGCNCKDDNNTLKLNDNKLGINTYAALLCTLQKEWAPQWSIVDTQRQYFRKILTPTIVASIENKKSYENIA